MGASHWPSMKLGDFVTLQRGHDLPEHQRKPGKVPVLGSFGITGYHDAPKAKGPGVTVGRSGASFGVVSYSPVDYWPLNTALYVKNFHGNDEKFSYYFLKSIDFKRFNSGSAQPSLNRNFIHPIEVRIPPLDEQKKIAHILGTLDDKIELNQQMNQTLEGIARALFKSWFIDFDPVRAKLDGRQPYGMDAETAALFPDSFDDSPLGKIPKGWKCTNLGEQTELLTGYPFKSKLFASKEEGGYKLARGDNVKEGVFQWGDKAKYWPTVTADLEGYKLEEHDILIGMDGSKVGKNWVRVQAHHLPILLVQRVACLRAVALMSQFFIRFLVGSTDFVNYVELVKTGTSIPHISGRQIKSLEFVIPDYPEILQSFHEAVSPLFGQYDHNDRERETLLEMRDALLPKLLSDGIRLKDAQQMLEEVT